MNFRRALLRIGQEIGQRDLDSLKFACRDAIPESRMDFIHSAKDVFLVLEEKGLLSQDKLDYLTRQLIDIGRPQLLSHLEAFGFHVHDSSASPDSSSSAESHFTRCLLAISQKLNSEEIDRLAFAWCSTHLSTSPDKIFSAYQLFTLMSHKLIFKPDNLQVLYIELNEMGRQDLCKIIEEYFLHTQRHQNGGRSFTPSHSPTPLCIREDSQPYDLYHNLPRPTNLSFSSTQTSTSDLSYQMSQIHLVPPPNSSPQNGDQVIYNSRKESKNSIENFIAPPPHYIDQYRPSSAASGSNDGSPGQHYPSNGPSSTYLPPGYTSRTADEGEGTMELSLALQRRSAQLARKEEELQALSQQLDQERSLQKQPLDTQEVHLLQEALRSKNKEVNELRETLTQYTPNQQGVKTGDLYQMTKTPHGICLIINNYEFFQVEERYELLTDRSGAQKDQENLKETFNFLQYSVELHENVTSEGMVDVLKEVSSRDHSNYDSFVCCILTHGEEGQVFGSDSKPVNLQDLTGIMKATFTRSLINKPKLFFVQACRGDGEEKGIPIEKDGDPSLPVEADFLFGYATPTGKAAYRSRRHGSWFISELCQVFLQDSCQLPLGAMMKKINRRVSDAYTKEGYKQCTEVVDRLRKDVVFFCPADKNDLYAT